MRVALISDLHGNELALDAVRRGRRLAIPGWRQRLMVSAIQLAPRGLVARLSALASKPAPGVEEIRR